MSGYTDDIGTEQYNQKLPERRADAVRDYLVHAGVDPHIIDSKRGHAFPCPRLFLTPTLGAWQGAI